jgi:hypothetical protein
LVLFLSWHVWVDGVAVRLKLGPEIARPLVPAYANLKGKMMRARSIASLLICGVVLVAVSPSKVLGQTAGQPAAVRGEGVMNVERGETKPRLKVAFAGELEKNKGDKITREEIRRLEKGWLPQAAPKSHSFNKKAVAFAVVVVVVITALAIVLEHNGVNPVTRCDDDPTVPGCVP